MAFEVKGLERMFRFNKSGNTVTLTDPGADYTPDQVMNLYSNQYPELTTATVHGPKFENDKAVYEFKTVIGTKG